MLPPEALPCLSQVSPPPPCPSHGFETTELILHTAFIPVCKSNASVYHRVCFSHGIQPLLGRRVLLGTQTLGQPLPSAFPSQGTREGQAEAMPWVGPDHGHKDGCHVMMGAPVILAPKIPSCGHLAQPQSSPRECWAGGGQVMVQGGEWRNQDEKRVGAGGSTGTQLDHRDQTEMEAACTQSGHRQETRHHHRCTVR